MISCLYIYSSESTDVGDIEISAVGHLNICSQVDMMDICLGREDGCYDFEDMEYGELDGGVHHNYMNYCCCSSDL